MLFKLSGCLAILAIFTGWLCLLAILDVLACKSEYAACSCRLCCLDGFPGKTLYTSWKYWLCWQSYLTNLIIRLAMLAVYGAYAGYANFISWPCWLAMLAECTGGYAA